MKHYRILPLLLVLALILSLTPALAVEESAWTGPLSEDALPTLVDTGRGYIAYYFYASAIYWSPDGVNWTDLSDCSWVQEARDYIGRALGHREFQVIWTGTEYMLRQDLRDDARSAYQTIGDSPRNSTVTFLDEDFQIIGELPLGGAVTDIRYEDDTYYATVDGNEVAFTREEWLPKDLTTEFSDVPADAWYAPYIEVCVQAGVIQGTGDGRFEPENNISCREGTALLLRLYDVLHGGGGVFPAPPEDWIPVWVEDEAGKMLFTAQDSAGWSWGKESVTLYFYSKQTQELEETAGTVRLGSRQFSGTFLTDELRNNQIGLKLSGYSQRDRNDLADAFGPYFSEEKEFPDWIKSAWYYAQANGLDELVQLGGEWSATEFAKELYQVCGELPAQFSAEYVPHFNREKDPEIYSLREAGIWNGLNETDTHNWHGGPVFSRANAAILVARILDERLRLERDPDALPHEGYTLTYLMDEPPEVTEHMPGTYPVVPTEAGALTLSGELVPWPDETGSPTFWHCYQKGEYLSVAFFGGSVDHLATEGAAGCIRYLYGWMDATGQLVTPLSPQHTDPPEGPVFERPYAPSEQGIYYAGDRPVSQKFDWCGDLSQSLQGFVGLEGKIYRIEFGK